MGGLGRSEELGLVHVSEQVARRGSSSDGLSSRAQ